MALYTDNVKTDTDSALTYITINRWHGSYRLAGGAPVRALELPVQGAGDDAAQLAAAKAILNAVNPYTETLIGKISQMRAKNADNDVPTRAVGRMPTLTMFFDVYNAAGSSHKKVALPIPYFKGAAAGTDAAAVLAAVLTPLIKVFDTDDIVIFSGSTAT